MNHQQTVKWLKTASAIVIGFGLLTVVSVLPGISELMRLFLDLAFWPLDGAQNASGGEVALLSAILGGITIGWGVMFWQVSARLYPRDPELARSLILSSIVTWFVIDSTGSVLAGAPFNALYNASFLLLFAVPLRRAERVAHS